MQRAIIILIVILNIQIAFYEVYTFHIPHWLKHPTTPDVFDIADFILRLLHYLSVILVAVGVYQLIRDKKFELTKTFKFPIYFFVILTIFYKIYSILSTQFPLFPSLGSENLYYYVNLLLSISFIALVISHYWSQKLIPTDTPIVPVSKSARLGNWAIDISIIFAIGITGIRFLMGGWIFESVPIVSDNPYLYYAVHIFLYFFILELIFLQTISKIRNDTMVAYSESRFKSIFIRTLCRFIPFEAFSFLSSSKPGWHDDLSKTTVIETPVKVVKTNSNTPKKSSEMDDFIKNNPWIK